MTAVQSVSTGSNVSKVHRVKKTDTNGFYVKALQAAGGFHRQSFHIEMAVCLAFYAEHKAANLEQRKALRPIYEKAGYQCADAKGEDYKTVARRIGVSASLYTFLGGDETITDWSEGAMGQQMIDSVVKELQKRKLNNIADVQALVGKASKRAYKKRQTSQAPQVAPTSQETPVEASKGLPGLQAELSETDAKIASLVGAQMGLQKIVAEGNNLPPERILKTEHLSLGIPVGVSHEEVKKMALMLLEFAATKMAEVVEAKAEGLAH